MAELGIPYTLTSNYGRAVFGNCDAATADPDFVGDLAVDSGISGLLGAPDTRQGGGNRPAGEGGYDAGGLVGRRQGTISGITRADGTEMVGVNAKLRKLYAATHCVDSDGVLSWTPSGTTVARMLRVRRLNGPDPAGRRPKTWQVTLESRDAWPLDLVERTSSSTNISSTREAFTHPANDGDHPAYVWYRVRFTDWATLTVGTGVGAPTILSIDNPGSTAQVEVDLFPWSASAYLVSDGSDVTSWCTGPGTTGGTSLPINWSELIPDPGATLSLGMSHPSSTTDAVTTHLRRRWFA